MKTHLKITHGPGKAGKLRKTKLRFSFLIFHEYKQIMWATHYLWDMGRKPWTQFLVLTKS